MKRFLDKLYFSLTGLIGLCGFVFSLTNNWLSNYYGFQIERQFLIVIGLLSALLIALGYERWKQREEIEKKIQSLFADLEKLRIEVSTERLGKIDTILELVMQQPNAEIVSDKDSISNKADSYILTAKDSIYATSFGFKKTTERTLFNELLARKLQVSADAKSPVEYRSVCRKGRDMTARKNYFKEKGVLKYIKLREYDNPPFLDMLIIDKKYLFIAFPQKDIDEDFRNCIFIQNNEQFIGEIRDWYLNFIWDKSKESNT